MPKTKNAKKNKYLIKIIDELIYTTDTKNIFNCYALEHHVFKAKQLRNVLRLVISNFFFKALQIMIVGMLQKLTSSLDCRFLRFSREIN